MPTPVERYEHLYPDTGVGDAQKQERGERLAHKLDRASHRRTTRTRGVVVPRVPWHEKSTDQETSK